MFTGIIKTTAKIVSNTKKSKGYELVILSDLKCSKKDIGSSISVNGVCLTLTSFIKKKLFFFISYKTFELTNFKYLTKNSLVNLERSLKFGDEIAGHFVQGHVDTTGKVKLIKKKLKTWTVFLSVTPVYSSYLIDKGSISINGVSLTIVKASKNIFSLVIIPHTLKQTNLITLSKDDVVNIEFDIVIKYLRKIEKK